MHFYLQATSHYSPITPHPSTSSVRSSQTHSADTHPLTPSLHSAHLYYLLTFIHGMSCWLCTGPLRLSLAIKRVEGSCLPNDQRESDEVSSETSQETLKANLPLTTYSREGVVLSRGGDEHVSVVGSLLLRDFGQLRRQKICFHCSSRFF